VCQPNISKKKKRVETSITILRKTIIKGKRRK